MIEVLEWPSQSPDLNPMKICSDLKRAVHRRCPHNQDFGAFLQKEWANIAKSRCAMLIDSYPKRLSGVKNQKVLRQSISLSCAPYATTLFKCFFFSPSLKYFSLFFLSFAGYSFIKGGSLIFRFFTPQKPGILTGLCVDVLSTVLLYLKYIISW